MSTFFQGGIANYSLAKKLTPSHHLLPIYLRVTIDGKRFGVATHQHTDPAEWSPTVKAPDILQVNSDFDNTIY